MQRNKYWGSFAPFENSALKLRGWPQRCIRTGTLVVELLHVAWEVTRVIMWCRIKTLALSSPFSYTNVVLTQKKALLHTQQKSGQRKTSQNQIFLHKSEIRGWGEELKCPWRTDLLFLYREKVHWQEKEPLAGRLYALNLPGGIAVCVRNSSTASLILSTSCRRTRDFIRCRRVISDEDTLSDSRLCKTSPTLCELTADSAHLDRSKEWKTGTS